WVRSEFQGEPQGTDKRLPMSGILSCVSHLYILVASGMERRNLAAAEDLGREFGASGEEGEGCGGEPDERREGDGEDVFCVGGDGRQKVRGCGCAGVGDECGEECAG